VHALAFVRAVEDALNLEIELDAQYIRNLILMAHALHDHVVHFYQLSALDWIDVIQVLKPIPTKPRPSPKASPIGPKTPRNRWPP
jgi:hydrogenase large subunit